MDAALKRFGLSVGKPPFQPRTREDPIANTLVVKKNDCTFMGNVNIEETEEQQAWLRPTYFCYS